jgi:hypothetical protein
VLFETLLRLLVPTHWKAFSISLQPSILNVSFLNQCQFLRLSFKLHNLHRYLLDALSFFKFVLTVINSVLFSILLVFELLLCTSENILCSMFAVLKTDPSARHASAATLVCRDVDVFGTKRVSLNGTL